MSVTISGPKGYEFQYRVTVLAALINLDNAVALFVEKKGTEDAEVRIQIAGAVRIYDIQVKNSNNAVELKTLSEWLCHFEERVAVNNLLDRIITQHNYCLFVAAGRCVDTTSHFVSKMPGLEEHGPLTINQAWVDGFANELVNNIWSGTTTLQKERHAFCVKQGVAITSSMNVEKDLRRIIIWEQVVDDQVDSFVNFLLNKKYKIPQSVTEDTYLQLLEAVRKGRDQQADILADFKVIIEKNTGEKPFVDTGYQTRSEESSLISSLKTDGIVLLSGSTQSGKSELGRQLASVFYDKGFAYYITADVSDVSRFFSMNQNEDKICVLEDPWGHIQAIAGSIDSWHKLGMILANKRANHKLIVTSRSEIVSELALVTGSASFKGHVWADVTVSDREVLKAFWQTFSVEKTLDAGVAETIAKHLVDSPADSLLQIGQLHHLSRIDNNDITGKNADELLHLARQSAAEIAGSLLSNWKIQSN
ncbi:MAG: hypothetical protein Q8K92_00050 [Leadbetterella sp.]|nr:hypothetical protein [Leadbetterella sp.]